MKRLIFTFVIFTAFLPRLAFADVFSDLAVNTWTHVGTNMMSTSGIVPNPLPAGNSGHTGVMAYSGGFYDTSRDRLLVFGGGHQDYSGNEIYAFTLSTLAWTRISGPTAAGSVQTGEVYADGNPSSRHTYSSILYLPNVDKYFAHGGSLWSASGGMGYYTWLYTPSTDTWAETSNRITDCNAGTSSSAVASSIYNTHTGTVWVYRQDQRLCEFDPTDGSWTDRSSASISLGGLGDQGQVTAVYDQAHKKFCVIGDTNFKCLDLTNPDTTGYTWSNQSPSGTSTCQTARKPGVAYDSHSGQIVCWPGTGSTVYTIDLTTNAWTAVTAAGGSETPSNAHDWDGSNGQTYGRFQYVPSKNVFVLINDVDESVYVYRLTSSTATFSTSVPSLQDERDAYTLWGWSWNASQEPANVFPASGSYTLLPYSGIDLHNDPEGDDLQTYVWQYWRTGYSGYLNRRNKWETFEEDTGTRGYLDPTGQSNGYDSTVNKECQSNYCDHVWVGGLVDLYLSEGNSAALTAAQTAGAMVNSLWFSVISGESPGDRSMAQYGPRLHARSLLVATQLYAATGNATWSTLRDSLIAFYLASPDWNSTWKMYQNPDSATDTLGNSIGQSNASANGWRSFVTYQTAIMIEAFYAAWEQTGNATLKQRILDIATFLDQYALDDTSGWMGSRTLISPAGVSYGCSESSCVSTGYYPENMTNHVNALVYAYKLTGNSYWLTRAKYFLNQGTKFNVGTSPSRRTADGAVDHFMSVGTTGNVYLTYNTCHEIRCTYRIFENGGSPTVLSGEPTVTPVGAFGAGGIYRFGAGAQIRIGPTQ